jgi:hypothetical protein
LEVFNEERKDKSKDNAEAQSTQRFAEEEKRSPRNLGETQDPSKKANLGHPALGRFGTNQPDNQREQGSREWVRCGEADSLLRPI